MVPQVVQAVLAAIWGLSFSKGHRLTAIRLGTVPLLLRSLRPSGRTAQHSDGAPCAPGTTHSTQVPSLKTDTSHQPISPAVSTDRQVATEYQGSGAAESDIDSRSLSNQEDVSKANLSVKHERERLASMSREGMSAGLTLEVLHPFLGFLRALLGRTVASACTNERQSMTATVLGTGC